MSRNCNCEHWEQCPVCMPHRFDVEGRLLPIPKTPLQDAQDTISELRTANEALTTRMEQIRKALAKCKFDSLNMTFDDMRFIRSVLATPDNSAEILARRDAAVLQSYVDGKIFGFTADRVIYKSEAYKSDELLKGLEKECG